MQERAVQERAFLSSGSQLRKDTQWEYCGGGGGGWAGRTLISYKQVLPLLWKGCRHRGGGSVTQERGKGMTGGAGTLGQGGSQGKGREVPWKPGRGECPLNSCQVQVVLRLLPRPPGPPSAPPSLRLLRRAEDMTDNALRIRSPEGRASMWVPSAPRHHLPKQEASSECPPRAPSSGSPGTQQRARGHHLRKLQLGGPKRSLFPSPKGHLLREAAHDQTPSQQAHPTTRRLHPSAPQTTLVLITSEQAH